MARAAGRPAVFLMSSPLNPTGTVHTADELRVVADIAARHGVRVVVDEIHAPLVYDGSTFVPYLTVPGGERGFSLISASKAWNLAGLKAAVLVAGDEVRSDLARIPTEVSFGASHLGVLAQAAAFRDGGPWLDGLLAALDRNRPRAGHAPGDAPARGRLSAAGRDLPRLARLPGARARRRIRRRRSSNAGAWSPQPRAVVRQPRGRVRAAQLRDAARDPGRGGRASGPQTTEAGAVLTGQA